ncbi:MAG TPA: GNAT family N-acetyltransferase [Gemmatimonadales bacterium]|nr:GNAT family N-acetyltransferase [Gemmatimonadales bacterium]
MIVRNATEADLDRLAMIWHQGWHEAHASLVPAELTRLRTLPNFRERLQAALPDLRVAGEPSAGFCQLKDDELFQLYVSAEARGSGVAAALIADAEKRLAEGGVEVAWLACAIGNQRAARFYEKSGWARAGVMIDQVETSVGPRRLEVLRYEKRLRPPPHTPGPTF